MQLDEVMPGRVEMNRLRGASESQMRRWSGGFLGVWMGGPGMFHGAVKSNSDEVDTGGVRFVDVMQCGAMRCDGGWYNRICTKHSIRRMKYTAWAEDHRMERKEIQKGTGERKSLPKSSTPTHKIHHKEVWTVTSARHGSLYTVPGSVQEAPYLP